MSETVTCAKCMYTAKFFYTTGEMVKIFFDNHDCDLTKLQQAIERVRELHKEDNTGYCELCTAIATPDGSDYLSKYPCPTIKALDGDK